MRKYERDLTWYFLSWNAIELLKDIPLAQGILCNGNQVEMRSHKNDWILLEFVNDLKKLSKLNILHEVI